jgi:tetratricopeptide (TPR) repeat protein
LFPVKGEATGRMSVSVEDHRLGSIDPELHVRAVEAAAPESAEAFYVRALKATDTRQQIELLDRALDRNPGDPLASLAKMIALGHLMDHELVLAEADRLITARPKSAQGWRMKADAYRQQRDFERATAAIARALDVDDRDPRNYLQRARIQRDRGEKEEALSELARAIELDPSQSFLYQERADLLVGMGRYEEAIADARKFRELNPDHWGAWI